MRIDGGGAGFVNGIGPALQVLMGSLAKGERFQADPEAPPPAAVPPPPAALANSPPPTSVQMLVTLAAIDPAAERRRKEAVQADRGLTMLERLREALAAGAVPPEALRELAAWADGFAVPDDPVLAEIGRDIELRVRVELAKLDLRA